jgi:hypothetical protein
VVTNAKIGSVALTLYCTSASGSNKYKVSKLHILLSLLAYYFLEVLLIGNNARTISLSKHVKQYHFLVKTQKQEA